jgi:hypothetical protein
MPVQAENLTGKRFGRLLVKKQAPTGKRNNLRWHCLCDCGRIVISHGGDLRRGKAKSCGCLSAELTVSRNLKHGHTSKAWKTPEYHAWQRMFERCYNKHASGYERYGGRGIKVCKRWRDSYEAFYTDVGPRPSPKHSIDRFPNNDGDYEPGNVRWAAVKEQARNTRTNRFHTFEGQTLCEAEWAERFGFHVSTLRHRLRNGWSIEHALTTPVKHTSGVSS